MSVARIFRQGWGGYPPHTKGPKTWRWVAAWTVFWTATALMWAEGPLFDIWYKHRRRTVRGWLAGAVVDGAKAVWDPLLARSARLQNHGRGPWKVWR